MNLATKHAVRCVFCTIARQNPLNAVGSIARSLFYCSCFAAFRYLLLILDSIERYRFIHIPRLWFARLKKNSLRENHERSENREINEDSLVFSILLSPFLVMMVSDVDLVPNQSCLSSLRIPSLLLATTLYYTVL